MLSPGEGNGKEDDGAGNKQAEEIPEDDDLNQGSIENAGSSDSSPQLQNLDVEGREPKAIVMKGAATAKFPLTVE